MFSFLVLFYNFFIMLINIWFRKEIVKIFLVIILWVSRNPYKIISFFFNPFLFHCFTKANLSNLFSNFVFHLRHGSNLSHLHFGHKLEFRRTILSITFTLFSKFNFFSFNDIKFKILFSSKRLKTIIKCFFIKILLYIKVFSILDFPVIINEFKYGFFNCRHILSFHFVSFN